MSTDGSKAEPEEATGPSEISTANGKVVEQKPDGSAVRMEPTDAVETAQRLLESASKALGHSLIERGHKKAT